MARARPPFDAVRWDLRAGTAGLSLAPIDGALAATLAASIVAIDPWRRMGYGADAMARYLADAAPGGCRRAIFAGSAPIGAVSIRHPWLRGPYLELLAVLPGHQSRGAGGAILEWMAQEVAGISGNLWVCTSTFNDRGLAFYQRHGFERVADLDGLVGPDFTEILLRKRI